MQRTRAPDAAHATQPSKIGPSSNGSSALGKIGPSSNVPDAMGKIGPSSNGSAAMGKIGPSSNGCAAMGKIGPSPNGSAGVRLTAIISGGNATYTVEWFSGLAGHRTQNSPRAALRTRTTRRRHCTETTKTKMMPIACARQIMRKTTESHDH